MNDQLSLLDQAIAECGLPSPLRFPFEGERPACKSCGALKGQVADRGEAKGWAWACVAECYREKKRRYRKKNPEKVRESNRRYYQKNTEKAREQDRRWREKNPEKTREKDRRWREKNPEKTRELRRRRRARKAGAAGSHTSAQLAARLAFFGECCADCGVDLSTMKLHWDHTIPLALGGTNFASNFRPLCASCNLSKGAKHPFDYYPRFARLLELTYDAEELAA